MHNLIKVEFYKLRTSKLFWLMMLSGVVQGVAGPLLAEILRTKTGENMLIFSLQTQQFLFWIPIIGIFGYFVGAEFHNGSIKNLVAYGHRRKDIVIAKSIAFYVGVIIISIIFPLVLTVINTILNGYGRAFDLQALLVVLRISFLMILIYAAIGSILIAFAYLFRNAILPCALFISLDSVSRFGQAFSLRSRLVEAVYGKTIFYQLNYATLKNMTFSQGMEVVAVSLITLSAATAIAIYAFNKADLK